jgi:hypothetical protein
LFGNKIDQTKFIVGASKVSDLDTYWQVVRTIPPSNVPNEREIEVNEVWYDDFILLRHLVTSCYLTRYKVHKNLAIKSMSRKPLNKKKYPALKTHSLTVNKLS